MTLSLKEKKLFININDNKIHLPWSFKNIIFLIYDSLIFLFLMWMTQCIYFFLVNLINEACVSNGYWQIFVVIPPIDFFFKGYDDPNTVIGKLIIILYDVVFLTIMIIMGISMWLIDRKTFHQYVLITSMVYLAIFIFSIIFPCWDYLHDRNWKPFSTDRDKEHQYGATRFSSFPSYHMAIAYCPFMFWRKMKGKLCKSIMVFNIFIILGLWLLIMLNKQHYFLDAVGTFVFAEVIYWIVYKRKFTYCLNYLSDKYFFVYQYNKKQKYLYLFITLFIFIILAIIACVFLMTTIDDYL